MCKHRFLEGEIRALFKKIKKYQNFFSSGSQLIYLFFSKQMSDITYTSVYSSAYSTVQALLQYGCRSLMVAPLHWVLRGFYGLWSDSVHPSNPITLTAALPDYCFGQSHTQHPCISQMPSFTPFLYDALLPQWLHLSFQTHSLVSVFIGAFLNRNTPA